MRNLFLPAIAVCFASCTLFAASAKAETFTLNAKGFDVNTGLTTVASFNLAGTPDAVAGAYDLTSGSGIVTITSSTGDVNSQSMNLYLPSGTATLSQSASFTTPGNPSYTYDNVVYPGGSQLNNALGAELDEFGLLFTSSAGQFNIFGSGGYAYTNGDILFGFNSPLQTFSLVDTTNTGVTPEPSSIALLGTGLLGVAGMMRRRFNV